MGNIGKRHLQSISNLSLDFEVFCYDKVKNAVDSVPDFCKNSLEIPNIQYLYDIRSIEQKIDEETIVIIATTAEGRKEILEVAINKQPLTIISEKPLTQNITDYENIIKLSSQKGVPIYIIHQFYCSYATFLSGNI